MTRETQVLGFNSSHLVSQLCLSTFFKLPGTCLYLSTFVSTPRGSRSHLWSGRLQARQGEVTDCNLDSSAVGTSDMHYELQDIFMGDRCVLPTVSRCLALSGLWAGGICGRFLVSCTKCLTESGQWVSSWCRHLFMRGTVSFSLWLVRRVGVVWAKPGEDKCVLLRATVPPFPARLSPSCHSSEVISKTSEGFLPVSQCGPASSSPPAPSQGQFYQQSHHLKYASTSPSTQCGHRSTFLALNRLQRKTSLRVCSALPSCPVGEDGRGWVGS